MSGFESELLRKLKSGEQFDISDYASGEISY